MICSVQDLSIEGEAQFEISLKGAEGGGRATRKARMNRQPQQQQLYLIFDSLTGYGIFKVDPHGRPPDTQLSNEVAIDFTLHHLPPAVLHLEARRGLPVYFAAAFKNKIMAFHAREELDNSIYPVVPSFVPVFNVLSRGIMSGYTPKAEPCHSIYIPVGKRLYALSARSLEWLAEKPRKKLGKGWARRWRKVPDAPFDSKDVTSYAVHPDGRTCFLSVLGRTSISTFTFTKADKAEETWMNRGEWALPFTGRAHIDPDLNAWVGFSILPDPYGHLCTCDVPSVESDAPYPTYRISKERLLSQDPIERFIGATLVYMGRKSQYCLVECICVECNMSDDESTPSDSEDEEMPPHCNLVRLSTFSLKYDENGVPSVGNSLQVQYYVVPPEASALTLKRPFAFWM